MVSDKDIKLEILPDTHMDHNFDDGFDRELEFILDTLEKTNQIAIQIKLPTNPKLKDYSFFIMPIKKTDENNSLKPDDAGDNN